MKFLSDIALAEGDMASAQAMLREGLTLTYQERDAYAVPLILPHCASLAATRGNYISAVQLVAAGRSLYLALKVFLPLNDQQAFDLPLAMVRPLLPPKRFAQAWAVGERMTMAEAVALALAEITDHPSTADAPQLLVAHHA